MSRIGKFRSDPSEEIFETVVRDGTGRQLARWKVKKKDFAMAIRRLNEQFGLGLQVIDKRKSNDLDWLKD